MLSTTTYSQFLQNAQTALLRLRDALDECADLESFAAGTAPADWVTAGAPNTADAQAVLGALADANGMANLYKTGSDSRNPGTLTGSYNYGASQRIVIGPQ